MGLGLASAGTTRGKTAMHGYVRTSSRASLTVISNPSKRGRIGRPRHKAPQRVGGILGLLILAACCCFSASADTYRLDRSVIAGGAGTLQGGPFALHGTVAQPVVGREAAGPYSVGSGFWTGANAPDDRVFANGFES
jgi:hypothetical protein